MDSTRTTAERRDMAGAPETLCSKEAAKKIGSDVVSNRNTHGAEALMFVSRNAVRSANCTSPECSKALGLGCL